MMVMAELPKPRDTYVLFRGQYDKKGKRLSPPHREPAADAGRGPTQPAGAGGNGSSITQPTDGPRDGQPLLAILFRGRAGAYRRRLRLAGRGRATQSCSTGWPLNSCIRGWDVKRMHRLIVTSATYRQSSRTTLVARERDPENRLLGRGAACGCRSR